MKNTVGTFNSDLHPKKALLRFYLGNTFLRFCEIFVPGKILAVTNIDKEAKRGKPRHLPFISTNEIHPLVIVNNRIICRTKFGI